MSENVDQIDSIRQHIRNQVYYLVSKGLDNLYPKKCGLFWNFSF